MSSIKDSSEEIPLRKNINSGNASPNVCTPESSPSSSPGLDNYIYSCGYLNDPENDIVEDEPEIFDGKTFPRVLIPNEIWDEIADKNVWHESFRIPARMGGVLIGRFGKNVRELRQLWQAEFSLSMCPGQQDILLFKISCPIQHKQDVLQWVNRRFRMRPSKTPIGNPNQLRRFLPLGLPVSVHVRSCYGLKEFFVTIRDEEFNRYLEMQQEMDADYSQLVKFRMQLCEPVTSGTVAILPHEHGFARVLVLKVFPLWPKHAFYFLLDHGSFGIAPLSDLRKIRAKYMKVPFQAVHVSWAHAMPVFSDMPDLHLLRTYFNSNCIHAHAVRMETCCKSSAVLTDTSPIPQPQPLATYSDILASACRAGLFMVNPLVIHHTRQTWLNCSETPYYNFPYSDIDYSSLVTYTIEDVVEQPENEENSTQVYKTKEDKNKSGGQNKSKNKRKPLRAENGQHVRVKGNTNHSGKSANKTIQ